MITGHQVLLKKTQKKKDVKEKKDERKEKKTRKKKRRIKAPHPHHPDQLRNYEAGLTGQPA